MAEENKNPSAETVEETVEAEVVEECGRSRRGSCGRNHRK